MRMETSKKMWGRGDTNRDFGPGTSAGVEKPTSTMLPSPRNRSRFSFENWTYQWLLPKLFLTCKLFCTPATTYEEANKCSAPLTTHSQFSRLAQNSKSTPCYQEWPGNTKLWLIEECTACPMLLTNFQSHATQHAREKKSDRAAGGRRAGSVCSWSWCWMRIPDTLPDSQLREKLSTWICRDTWSWVLFVHLLLFDL